MAELDKVIQGAGVFHGAGALQGTGPTLAALGYALAIGLLIGLERGWSARRERDGTRVAGFRTFGLLGLTGGIAGLVPVPAAAALLGGACLLILAGYVRQSRAPDELSATTAIASVMVLALGMLATTGRPVPALAVAAAATLMLSMRRTLHELVRGLSAAELRAAARYAILALVLVPLLPDRAMGPYGALNPQRLMLVIVFVSGLSFAGYVLARRARASRSLLVIAACGALVSSTAVTLAFARRMAQEAGAQASLAAGIALASAISVARVGVLIAVLAPRAIGPVAAILAPALALLVGATWLRFRAAEDGEDHVVSLGNPLELGSAVGLAVLVALSSIASRWALSLYGDSGVAVVLAIIGLADVDAAVIAFAAMPAGLVTPNMAGIALALPVMLNMLLKTGLVLGVSRSRPHLLAAAPLGAAAAAIALGIGVALA